MKWTECQLGSYCPTLHTIELLLSSNITASMSLLVQTRIAGVLDTSVPSSPLSLIPYNSMKCYSLAMVAAACDWLVASLDRHVKVAVLL